MTPLQTCPNDLIPRDLSSPGSIHMFSQGYSPPRSLGHKNFLVDILPFRAIFRKIETFDPHKIVDTYITQTSNLAKNTGYEV